MVMVEEPEPGGAMGFGTEADGGSGRHTRGRQGDGVIEAVADGGGEGGGALIALRHAKRGGRGGESEVGRRIDGQRDGGGVLGAATTAGNRQGVGAWSRTGADGDGHGGAAGAGSGDGIRAEADGGAGGHARGRQGDGVVEAAVDGGGERGRSLAALSYGDGAGRGREGEVGRRIGRSAGDGGGVLLPPPLPVTVRV